MVKDYLESCNQSNHSQVSSILAIFLLVNARLPHRLLVAAKHDLSSKASSQMNQDTEFVQVTKVNINYLASTTFSALLGIGDKIDLLTSASTSQADPPSCTPLQVYPVDNVPTSASIASLLPSKGLELPSLVCGLAVDSFASQNII